MSSRKKKLILLDIVFSFYMSRYASSFVQLYNNDKAIRFATCNSYEIVTKRTNACELVCAIIPLGMGRETYLWISKTFDINALNWNQSFNGQRWEKKGYLFFMCSFLFLCLKITEIEYCEKSQVTRKHLRTSLGKTWKHQLPQRWNFQSLQVLSP